MEEFTLKNNELDYGEILYEKSNAKTMYDAPTGKVGVKGWAGRIYMLLLSVLLVAWFIYSLLNQTHQENVFKAIVDHLAAFFVLIVCEIILLLSAFGGWGKFTRFAIRNNLTRNRGIEGVRTRKLAEEFATADANKANENAIRVYREYVVIVNNGEKTTLSQSDIRNVRCDALRQVYQLTFELYDGREIQANELIPRADLPKVKKHFERFEYTTASHGKGYLRKKLPMLAFTLIPVIIGVALIAVHFFVLPDIPLIFGMFFAFVGGILVIAQFSDIPIVQHGIIPLAFGLVFTALPFGIMFTIADMTANTENPLTIAAMLSTFTPIHAGLGLFLGLGPMMIIVGIAGIVDCVRM